MMAILLDVAVVAVLVFFLWRGAKRGFVLTVCGLAAVVVALVGASFLANLLAEPVAKAVEPIVSERIQESLSEAIQGTEFTATGGGVAETPEEVSLPGVIEHLKENDLFRGFADAFQEAVDKGVAEVTTNAAQSVAHFAAVQIAHHVLFILGFILVLILWFILSHALDLITRLPVLNTLNEVGGGVVGLLKGLLILCLVGAVLRFCGWPAPETVAETHILRFFTNENPIVRVFGL